MLPVCRRVVTLEVSTKEIPQLLLIQLDFNFNVGMLKE